MRANRCSRQIFLVHGSVRNLAHFVLAVKLRFIVIIIILHFVVVIEPMPSCYKRSNCKAPPLPLDNRHACALCKNELHGICGYFYQEESIRFQNVCGLCKSALEKKKFELKMAGLPALPHPLTAEQVRDTDVVPEIKKRVSELDQISDSMLPPKISSKPQEQST